jgi:5-methylthioribose kinase
LGDRAVFDALRLDPYYRWLAGRFPEARDRLNQLVRSVLDHALAVVHADFSPKNILIHSEGLLLVDYETGHFGDPAFDLGFFLSHLVLKSLKQAPRHDGCLKLTESFWLAYWEELGAMPEAERGELESRAIWNVAGCAWARIDGKSPVDYLDDASRREWVRQLARDWLLFPGARWSDFLADLRQRFEDFTTEDAGSEVR